MTAESNHEANEYNNFLTCTYLVIYLLVIVVSLYLQYFVSEKYCTITTILVGMIVSGIINLSGGYKPIIDAEAGFNAHLIGFSPRYCLLLSTLLLLLSLSL